MTSLAPAINVLFWYNCPRSPVSTSNTIKYPQTESDRAESDRLQLSSFHHSLEISLPACQPLQVCCVIESSLKKFAVDQLYFPPSKYALPCCQWRNTSPGHAGWLSQSLLGQARTARPQGPVLYRNCLSSPLSSLVDEYYERWREVLTTRSVIYRPVVARISVWAVSAFYWVLSSIQSVSQSCLSWRWDRSDAEQSAHSNTELDRGNHQLDNECPPTLSSLLEMT